ncbi:MAG TPA: hypothetical protein VJ749_16210 [Pyrinomonadaceae bacterium]|jgi:hypothetical protein|nr:hypothetical protein [Pyrinomonadaceae bacterium]
MRRIYVTTALLSLLLLSSLTVFAQTQSREDLLRQIEAKRAELSALETSFLSPSEEDRNTYSDFLRAPNTGLIRLLPREKFDGDAIRDGKKSIVMRGGGAYYSFSRLTHEYGYGSDIELGGGELSTGFAGADYGLLTNIGDVPLETVSLETPAAKVLASYDVPDEEPKARLEYGRFSTGTELDGIKVKNRLPLRVNTTYIVRSINYRESDVLVAFRVVRIDSDDSATIVWKLLKKYPTPSLALNRN